MVRREVEIVAHLHLGVIALEMITGERVVHLAPDPTTEKLLPQLE